MGEYQLPLQITYDTRGTTPLRDVIAALQAAEAAIEDAISLLPSVVDGVIVERSQITIRSLSQESPLREVFIASLVVAFQDDLNKKIPPLIESIFHLGISSEYDTVVSILTIMILLYGASFLKDAALKAISDGALEQKYTNIVESLSDKTGKSPDEIRRILDAKYGSPGPVKRLVKAVQGFFVPSQLEGGAPILFDRDRVGSDVIREIPYARELESRDNFEKYTSHSDVFIEIHAQDKDKINTGWAAIPRGISDSRLRMKIVEPVQAKDLWTKDTIRGDITVVSKLTPGGYVPSEIHLMRINDD